MKEFDSSFFGRKNFLADWEMDEGAEGQSDYLSSSVESNQGNEKDNTNTSDNTSNSNDKDNDNENDSSADNNEASSNNDNEESDTEEFNPDDDNEEDLDEDFDLSNENEADTEDFNPNDDDAEDFDEDFDPSDDNEPDTEEFNPNDDKEEDLEVFNPSNRENNNIDSGYENVNQGKSGATVITQENDQKLDQDRDQGKDRETTQELDSNDLEGESSPPDPDWDELETEVHNLHYDQDQEQQEGTLEQVVDEVTQEAEQEVIDDVIDDVNQANEQEEAIVLTEEYGDVPSEGEFELADEVRNLDQEQHEGSLEQVIDEVTQEAEQEVIDEVIDEVNQANEHDEEVVLTEEYNNVPSESEFELADEIRDLDQEQHEGSLEQIIDEVTQEAEQEVIDAVIDDVNQANEQDETITLTEEYGDVPSETEIKLADEIRNLDQEEQEGGLEQVIDEIVQETEKEIIEEFSNEAMQEIEQEEETFLVEPRGNAPTQDEIELIAKLEQIYGDQQKEELEDVVNEIKQENSKAENITVVKSKKDSSKKKVIESETKIETSNNPQFEENPNEVEVEADYEDKITAKQEADKELDQSIKYKLEEEIKSENKSDIDENQQDNSSNKKSEENETDREELHKVYHQETNGNAIYNGKESKPFLQWLENRKKKKTKQAKESVRKSEDSSKSKEEWDELLIKWINEADDEEISKEIKKELISLIKQYRKLEKNKQKYLQLMLKHDSKNRTSMEITELRRITKKFEALLSKPEIIRKLSIFIRFYKQNKRRNMSEINKNKLKFPKHFAQILQNIKSEIESLKDANNATKKNWTELLKANLNQISMLSLSEKSQINGILQKTKLSEEDKKELVAILMKLRKEELNKLFGKSFEAHANNYVQWGTGWYEDPGLKRIILNDFLKNNTKFKDLRKEQKNERMYETFSVGGDRRFKYHLEVPSKFKNDNRIVNAPAWKFFVLLKDQAYPDLSIAAFWSHLGFNYQYHQNLALHITQKLKKGVIYTPDVKTLEMLAQIISNDINIDKTLRNIIIKEIKKLSGIRENKLGTHWTGWKQTREKCWKLIDEYLKKNPALIQFNNYGKLQKDLMGYLSTNDDVHAVLSRDNKKLEHIMKGIIAIHLLQADNRLPQEDIRKISGFNNNRHVRNIRNVLNIPLPISFRNKQLFNDPDKKLRECSECNEIKSYNDFRTHYKDTEVFRSECRACESKKLCIVTYQKKLLALIFLTLKSQGKVDVDKFLKDVKEGKKFDLRFKCAHCDSDMTEFLPALDLNHLDPTRKQYEWGKLSSMSTDRIIRILNKKNIEIACANCHSLYHASTFTSIKGLILQAETFEEVANEIHGKSARRSARLSITKRKICEMLYDGSCQDCRKIGVDKIPALSFHHTQPELKTINPRKYINKNYQDIMKIKQKFLEEKLNLLCINCHRLEGSFIFDKYKQEILSKYLLD